MQSKEQKTIERLETIQKAAMEAAGMTDMPNGCPQAYMRYLMQKHPAHQIDELFLERGVPYPTSKYQDKMSFLRVYSVFDGLSQIVHGLKSEKILTRNIPIFGTLPQLEFAACVTFEDNESDEIILVSEGLLVFSRILAQIFGEILPIGKHEIPFIQSMKPSGETLFVGESTKHLFFQLFFIYYASKNCSYAMLGTEPPNEEIMAYSMGISEAFRCFALGHEYAHYLLGHTSQNRCNDRSRRKQITHTTDATIDPEIATDWMIELEADRLGAMLGMAQIMSQDISEDVGILGMVLCIKAIEGFEILDAFFDENNLTPTHPPASIRLEKLRETHPSHAVWFDRIDEVFHYLWMDFFHLKFRRIAKLYSGLDFSKISQELLTSITADKILSIQDFYEGVACAEKGELLPLFTYIGINESARQAIVLNNISRIYQNMSMPAFARQYMRQSFGLKDAEGLSAWQRQIICDNYNAVVNHPIQGGQ